MEKVLLLEEVPKFQNEIKRSLTDTGYYKYWDTQSQNEREDCLFLNFKWSLCIKEKYTIQNRNIRHISEGQKLQFLT